MNKNNSNFLCGYAAYSDLFFCVQESGGPKTSQPFSFLQLDGEEWSELATSSWPHVAIASIKPQGQDRTVLSVGSNGKYYEGVSGTFGVIAEDTPFLARNLAVVSDTIFAVGMNRVVARWDGLTTGWSRLDVVAKKATSASCGLNDLCGFSLDDIYAFGWGGEIWSMQKSKWQQIKSPTKEHLLAACTLPDGSIIAVGYNGTMIQGRDDSWTVVKTERKEALLDICCYKNQVYVATQFRLFKMQGSALVPVTEFEDTNDGPTSCGRLCVAHDDSTVFSLGERDLFRLTKGIWHRVKT